MTETAIRWRSPSRLREACCGVLVQREWDKRLCSLMESEQHKKSVTGFIALEPIRAPVFGRLPTRFPVLALGRHLVTFPRCPILRPRAKIR